MIAEAVKWYKKLEFPSECDEEFRKIIERTKDITIPENNAIEALAQKNDLGLNLVYFLSRCSEMKENFSTRLIPEEYFNATVYEIKRSGINCIKNFGCLGIYEINWIGKVVSRDSVFRIGRLNFEISYARDWKCIENSADDDRVLNIHIPPGEKLNIDECLRSMEAAKQFFGKYYSELRFRCFVCRSWLLYEGLDEFLGSGSNIRRFRKLFEIQEAFESDDAILFIFSKAANRKNISEFDAVTNLQVKIKEHILNNGKLYVGIGKRDF